MTPRLASGLGVAALIFVAVAFSVTRVETHKLITSKYTYNEDVFPILRDRCGRCHIEGGVAPMSLLTYKEAYPWGQSLRAELIAGHMPPWGAQDGVGTFKNAPKLTAAELDRILVWASGGNPEGNPVNVPPAVTPLGAWTMGKPDLMIDLPEAALAADKSELSQEFTVQTHTTEPRWIRAVDLLPGTPSIVRNATIAVRSGTAVTTASGTRPETMLTMWVPGEDPVPAEEGVAFQLPASSELVVRVHYKKTYKNDGKAMTDRSAVGLYFVQPPASEIRAFAIASPPVTATDGDHVVFSEIIDEDVRALAFSPDPTLSNASLQVDVISPTGARTPIIRLAVRPDFVRRYWFAQPLALPRGTRIEVVAELNGADGLLPLAASPTPKQTMTGRPVTVTLDVVR